MSTLRQTPISCAGHTRPVVDLNFSGNTPHGYFLISASKDGLPMLRQGDTGDWIGTFEGHKGAVWGSAINQDATRAATGAADFSAKLWDAVTGEVITTLPHSHIVKSVDFSRDSSRLVTASNEKTLKIYDLNSIDADPTVLEGHTSNLRACRWRPDGRVIVSASDDKTVKVWDVSEAKCVQTLTFNSAPSSLEITRDGSRLVITHGEKVAFYDADKWELVKEFDVPCPVYTASYLPDRDLFVCGGEDFKMYKYEYSSGEELEAVKGHFGPVHCVQFSPDGEIYASGSEDGTLRLWQTTVGKTYGLWKYECGAAGDTEGVNQASNNGLVDNGIDRCNE